MKNTIVGLILFLSSPLLGDKYYEDEVNAIHLRTATLIDQGRIRIDQFGSFKNAWIGVGFYANELSELVQIRMDPRGYLGDPDLLALHELTFEKVFIDTLQERLDLIIPKTEEFLQLAEGVIAQYPDLKIFQDPLKDQVVSELHQLSEVVDERKARLEENLQKWRNWQMNVALQAELDHQGVILDRLEITNDIGQVRAVLHRLWLNTFQEMYVRDFPASQQTLKGYSWFKSVIPLYFSDKITTQDQADYLKEILDEAQEKKNEMIAHYNLLTGVSSWRIFAEDGGEGDEGDDHEGEDHGGEDEGHDGDGFPKDSKDVMDIGTHMDPGSSREYAYAIERFDGDSFAVIKIEKDVCKYDDAGNGTAEITAEGNGFVRFGINHEPTDKIEVPSGPELQRAVDSGIIVTAFNLNGSVPCPPRTEKEAQDFKEAEKEAEDFKDKMDHLDKMVDHAHQEARNDEDKKGLQDIKDAFHGFQNYQNLLNGVIQNKVAQIKDAQDLIKDKTLGISKALPPVPSIRTPPSVDRSNILDQLDKVRQSIWGNAISSGSSISQPLDDFIQNLINGAPPLLQGPAKKVSRAIQQHGQPSKPIVRPTFVSMTSTMRQSILSNAKALRDGSKIVKYSQVNRLGPDSYDCSGFVTSMYAAAGLPFGYPNVRGILALTGANGPFKEVSKDDAKSGDLVVWEKGEGKNTYDHVAIYDGEQTVNGEKGPAVISTSSSASEDGDNTIQEILIKYMMGDRNNPIYHIFQWVKQN